MRVHVAQVFHRASMQHVDVGLTLTNKTQNDLSEFFSFCTSHIADRRKSTMGSLDQPAPRRTVPLRQGAPKHGNDDGMPF